MRLVFSSTNPKEARMLAGVLKSDGIETQLDVKANTDWGSAQYGDLNATLWVIDEDRYEEAERLVDRYKENPHQEIFAEPATPSAPPQQTVKANLREIPRKPFNASPSGLTLFFIMLCTLVYLFTGLNVPDVTEVPTYLPATPFVMSQEMKDLLYDYPKAYEIVDKLNKMYGIDRLKEPNDLPQEGKALIKKFQETPYWQGYYQQIVNREHNIAKPAGPLFEKIRSGEFWRLFTPTVLHAGILHLLFNMLWLAVLGKQMEQHIGKIRYLIFILIAAFVTNTCQYLVSGPNFMGFSGVVCAMLTFICVRQKVAPWEGYPLERSTALFLLVFIITMGALGAISFGLEVTKDVSIAPGIANTAHLIGAVLGAILGFFPFFSWRIS